MNEIKGLTDSHFHILSMKAKGIDPEAALVEFFGSGGRYAMDVGVQIAGWQERLSYGDRHQGLFFAAGVHPNEAPEGVEFSDDVLLSQLAHPRTLALGEIGLDWYRGRGFEREQKDLFRRQLALGKQAKKPIVIHNREADSDILSILKEEAWDLGGIFHCFSSGPEIAAKVLDLGFYVSFAGNVTYSSAQNIQDTARVVPFDRYLVETDSPYLSPHPLRGKTNRPLNTVHTATYLATLRGTDLQTVIKETTSNFEHLFGLSH